MAEDNPPPAIDQLGPGGTGFGRDRLMRLADSLPVLVSYIDRDFRYRFNNKAYERWFGHSRAEIAGHTMTEVLGEEAFAKLRPNIDRVLTGEQVELETLLPYKDGGPRHVHIDYVPDRGENGEIEGFYALVQDISERKTADDALRESEDRFRNMADHSPVMVWVTEADGQCTYLSASWYEFTGQTPEEGLGTGWLAAVHPDDRAMSEREFLDATAGQRPFRIEYRLRRADGQYRWAIDAASPRFGTEGEFLGFIGSVVEIHDRKRDEALQAARNRILELAIEDRPLPETLGDLVRIIEQESAGEVLGSILLLDDSGSRLLHGAAPSLPDDYNRAIDGVAIGPNVGSCGTAAHTGEPVFVSDIGSDPRWNDFRELALKHDLRACWSIPIRSGVGEVIGTFAMYHRQPREPDEDDLRLVDDVTRAAALVIERSRVQGALRENESRFRAVFQNAGVGMLEIDSEWRVLGANARYAEIAGRSERDVAGTNCLDFTHPDDVEISREAMRKIVSGEAERMSFEKRYIRPDGSQVWLRSNLARVATGSAGDRFLKIVEDITAQREAELALQQGEERYRTLFNSIDQGFCVIEFLDGPDGPLSDYVHVEANAAYAQHAGIENVVGQKVREMVPDEAAGWVELYRGVLETGKPIRFERELVATGRHLELAAFRIEPASKRQVAVLFKDDTARKRAEQALTALNETLESRVVEEIERRSQAEEALRQAQKMETVGQLSGGIAHDFNNLLQIIHGNLSILQRSLPTDDAKTQRSIANALKGAERAAALTQRLLAFSRRQPLDPRPIDVNQLIAEMTDLLHRTLGETVEVRTVLKSGVPPAQVDKNQLENALLNLAINARDAMADGGKLKIETDFASIDETYARIHPEAAPGRYVLISVKDSGHGMNAETLSRAVEPFFTTKEVGKGTGLGLSMVYGFASQSGGHLSLDSAEGLGTTVRIYLPVATGAAGTSDASNAAKELPAGNGEVVLVCEDDEDVRLFSVETLKELGYEVIEAHDAGSALAALKARGRVDLLFTDVVLPGGSTGADLAREATALQPGLKVLFTTGYARSALDDEKAQRGIELIAKPFRVDELAVRLRKILGK